MSIENAAIAISELEEAFAAHGWLNFQGPTGVALADKINKVVQNGFAVRAEARASAAAEPTRFVVKGRGLFPVDMLRHDRCWPVDGDINYIANPQILARGVDAVITLCAQSARGITPKRWHSFGWVVTEVDGVPVDWSNGRPFY